ncbi:hypothetical protein BV898_00236 [Hypsibius exemplaris]|uniref:Uncharacterized protein n=1 Tax=Hypsibius exemplaris TaxID=2072580 RepID=A0A1W0XFG8_HYPEX|nr:hypothetical protein BV898_00236 [Hypsibius exemplaris]
MPLVICFGFVEDFVTLAGRPIRKAALDCTNLLADHKRDMCRPSMRELMPEGKRRKRNTVQKKPPKQKERPRKVLDPAMVEVVGVFFQCGSLG